MLSRRRLFLAESNELIEEAIIHVGMHKAGSTAIQSAFEGYDRDGIVYPDLGYTNQSIPLYTVFSRRRCEYLIWRNEGLSNFEICERKEFYKRRLIHQLKKNSGNRIILSGEDISGLERDELFMFKSTLEPYVSKFTIVAYARDPASFLKSELQERIKQRPGEICFAPVDYAKRFEKFYEVFGNGAVRIFRYFSRQERSGWNIVDDFARKIGVSAPEKIERQNRSLSNLGVSFLALLDVVSASSKYLEYSITDRNLISKALQKCAVGSFSIPNYIVSPFVRLGDIEWLRSNAGIDFNHPAGDKDRCAKASPNSKQDLVNFIFEFNVREMACLIKCVKRELSTLPNEPLPTAALNLLDEFDGRLSSFQGFSSSRYLELNTDVASSKLHPVVHYFRHGFSENRRIY